MAGKSDYLENAALNAVLRGVTFPVIATTYVGVYTTAPTADDGSDGVEVSVTGYARVAVTSNTTNWKDPSTATQGQTNNLFKIVFPVANAPWGSMVGFGVWDAPTGGNLLYWATCSAVSVGTGDQLRFEETTLTIQED